MRPKLFAVILLTLACSACAEDRGQEIAKNVRTIRREQRPDRLLDIGKGFASVGDFTRAEEYFAAAIDQGGDEKVILPLLLRVCVLDGRYRSAIEYAENHLRHSPRDASTRFVIGTLYSAVGDVEHAKAAYTKVLNVEPDNADAHFALAVLLRDNEHDPVAADPHFREYLRLKPSGSHVEEAEASLVKPVVPVTMGVAPVTMGQPDVHLPTQIAPPDNEPKD
ncbi:MAG: tetratricopeptide repeat protein [Polyangiaceae bacterium]